MTITFVRSDGRRRHTNYLKPGTVLFRPGYTAKGICPCLLSAELHAFFEPFLVQSVGFEGTSKALVVHLGKANECYYA